MENDKLIEQIETKVNGLLKDANIASKSDFATLKSDIEIIKSDIVDVSKISELNGKLAKIEEAIASNKRDTEPIGKSLKGILLEKKGDFEALTKGGRGFSFVVPDNLAEKADFLRTSIANNTQSYRLPGFGSGLSYVPTAIEQAVTAYKLGTNNGGFISYVDMDTVTRNTGTVSEGANYPASDVTYKEFRIPLEKISDSVYVSAEALTDIPLIESELRRLLNVNLAIKMGEQIAIGNGTSPNLKGIYTTANTFNSVAYAGTKAPNANFKDLVTLLKSQITSNSNKYSPNTLVINPNDELLILFSKDTTGNYLVNEYLLTGRISGLNVVLDSNITQNTCVVYDSRFVSLYNQGAVMIEVGTIDKQFISDIVTIKAKRRSLLLVRNADIDCALKSTSITTDVGNITA